MLRNLLLRQEVVKALQHRPVLGAPLGGAHLGGIGSCDKSSRTRGSAPIGSGGKLYIVYQRLISDPSSQECCCTLSSHTVRTGMLENSFQLRNRQPLLDVLLDTSCRFLMLANWVSLVSPSDVGMVHLALFRWLLREYLMKGCPLASPSTKAHWRIGSAFKSVKKSSFIWYRCSR